MFFLPENESVFSVKISPKNRLSAGLKKILATDIRFGKNRQKIKKKNAKI